MEKTKKTALLKQVDSWQSNLPIRGVARWSANTKNLSIALLNLENKQEGKFYLAFEGQFFELDFSRGQDFNFKMPPFIGEEIAVIFYDGKECFPVAVGNFSARETEVEEVVKNAKKHFKKHDGTEEERVVFQEKEYDDEAIALTNYYEYERKLSEEEFVLANETPNNNEDLTYSQNEQRKEEKERDFGTDATIFACERDDGEEKQAGFWYYGKIKDEIENLFKQYPKEENLCKMVKGSRWVRINGDGKHYVVGLISTKSDVQYICYGLPSSFCNKPQGVKGFSHFIPISCFDLKGEGYWVSFQDAKNGKCIN